MTPHQLIDTASRHQVYLEGLKTGIVRDFNKVFDFINIATNDVLRALQVDVLSDLQRTELEKLLTELRDQHTILMDKQIDSFLGQMPAVADYESKFEARALASVMVGKGKKRIKTPPAEKAFREANKRPVQATGELLEHLVRDFATRAVTRINNVVRIGYEQGLTVPQIVSAIRGTKALRFKDGVTEVTRRQASTVVRTAVQHVASTARQVTWEKNSDLVQGVEWVSTLDGRTTTQCRSLDGKKFKLDEGPRPPIHANCRSTTAPDLDPAFDFLDEGATRSAAGGPVDANQTYYAWLKSQDSAFQDSVIGPTRGKLLRDGGLTSEQFAALQLDKNWQPLTLDEMKKLEPLAFQRAGLTN